MSFNTRISDIRGLTSNPGSDNQSNNGDILSQASSRSGVPSHRVAPYNRRKTTTLKMNKITVVTDKIQEANENEEAITPAIDMRGKTRNKNTKGSLLSINSSPFPNELEECKEDDANSCSLTESQTSPDNKEKELTNQFILP